ncbi:carbonic anhydrase 2-like isoform X2 [Liolophura sinensis]|uniref:carbonic anhydrase 2-like isoform X2 n=1 Tax=Liolophura sinensis TaxID=3198878 RepID=UPI0031589224
MATPVFLVTLVGLTSVRLTKGSAGNVYEWGYVGAHSPDQWKSHFPHCGGMRQSPIDINTDHVLYNENLGDLKLLNYDTSLSTPPTLINNGHTVQVNIQGDYFLQGGGLPSRYRVAQFHFHWGDADKRGSEHLVNGKAFPMEMHIVHYSTEYSNVSDALNRPNGLAVLAVLFTVGDAPNSAFDKVVGHLQSQSDVIKLDTFSLRSLLPVDVSTFFRYSGSLTTPPCYESVIWSLYRNNVALAESQVNKFRTLLKASLPGEGNGSRLVNDFRPVQPMNARVVETNRPIKGCGLSASPSVDFFLSVVLIVLTLV